MDIAFEEMKEAYLEEVRSIYNYYVRNSTATFQLRELDAKEMRELVFFDTPKYAAYVIKAGETVCGYVILTQFKKREAYDGTAEVTVYLKRGYTGKGIGSKAVSFIEERAKAGTCTFSSPPICGEIPTAFACLKAGL
jgi:phosphinothricin acetyltransferase